MRNFLQHKYSRTEDGVKVTYTGKDLAAMAITNVTKFVFLSAGAYLILVMLCVMG